MQTTSATWAALYAAGAPLEVRVEIGGTVYAETSAPVISRAAMQDRLSIGNVVSAALLLFVRTNAAIARSAEVAVSVRLNDGETASEWLPAGTFYISRRARDPVSGLLALECYDALLKANAVWEPSSGTWPRSMSSVVTEFLTLLGVSLDSRTVIPSGAAFVVSEPAEGTTIRDVLGMIGQAGCGNWIITPENKLRLVPLVSAAGAAEAETDAVDVAGVVGNIDVSGGGTITGVRDTWEGEVTLTGTDSGIVLDVSLPPLTAAEMSDAVLGQSYQAYSLTGAVYDPAAELGDYVRAGANGEIASVLYSERVTLAPAFRGDIGAPEAGELSDEYPYIGANARTLALARASIQQAVETLDDELDQQEIFNRLTDNGAAQGLVLYNGQLYINASYINAGTISADRINLNTYNPDFLIPDENDSSTLLPGQSISNGWVVQTGANITVLKIPNAEKYRGQAIEISATSQNFVSNGTEGWYTQDSSDPGALPEEHASAWYAPTYGTVSSDGTLTGATMNEGYYKYTRRFTIPNDAIDAYTVAFGCSGVKAITVSTGVSSELGLRYAQNISIDNTGLQVGKFVVNRSGDATFNGDVAFNGGISGIPAGVKGNAESSYRTGNVNLTPANIGAVALSGDTMSGNLYITATGEHYVKVTNTNTQCAVYLDSSVSKHGLWSNGYFDGSNFVSDGKWLLYRENESTPHFAGLAQNLESNLSVANGGIIGSWTPEIWDYNTKKATLPAQTYYKIGPLYILFIYTNIADAITIGTMLQIRGLPCASCFGGSLYCGGASDSLGGRTIQPSSTGVYVRPNYVGTIQYLFGAMLIGTNISV